MPKGPISMKYLALLTLFAALFGCGPDRNLIMETKFDAPLRQALSAIEEGDSETLSIIGRCAEAIDGPMRLALTEAGADVETTNGDIFTAKVSSDNVFSLAALDFVTQVHLSQTSKLLKK